MHGICYGAIDAIMGVRSGAIAYYLDYRMEVSALLGIVYEIQYVQKAPIARGIQKYVRFLKRKMMCAIIKTPKTPAATAPAATEGT